MLALGVSTIFLALTLRSWRSRRTDPKFEDLGAKIEAVRRIVGFGYVPDMGRDLPQRLKLRALPNERLVSAFGVNNSLTTSDPDIHRDFMRVAMEVTKRRDNNDSNTGVDSRWVRLYGIAETRLRHDLQFAASSKGQPTKTIPLADCAQRLCLTVVLVDNFDMDPADIPTHTASIITREINRQWISSKSEPQLPKSDLLNERLRTLRLRRLAGLSPEEILSRIMPQYETLWRVVLLTFVTAYHREYRPAAVKDMAEDVPRCLGDRNRERKALRLAEEGLRLYPSNKRIYRAPSTDSEERQEPLSADLEAIQRDPAIWGTDALEFRPERFDELTNLQKLAYFPYSIGYHKCPAFGGFGNRMITTLVVAMGRMLSREAGEVWFGDGELDCDCDGEARRGFHRPLPTGREDVDQWSFRLRHY